MAPHAVETPKGRTSPKSKAKEMAATKSFSNRAAERPAGKTPLAALLSKNQVKSAEGNGNLMLVTVNVLGSPGPLRFLVDRADTVARVVEMALRVYAREGRLPLLHSKLVELYCDNGDFKALHPSEPVGLLYRKKPDEQGGDQSNAISHPLKHWWSFMSSLVCSH